jgi:hypothetical protein
VAQKQMETDLFTKETNQKIHKIQDEISISSEKSIAEAKACKFPF